MRIALPDDRRRILTELQESIRRIERRPARRGGGVPCGVADVDAAAPDGFPRGAISELAGGPASGKTAVALSLLAGLGPEELFAWVDGRGELYPPAAAARGVDLGRLLIVRPGAVPESASAQAPLWAAEALLGSSAFAAVVIDVPVPRVERGWDATARRLQAAAEKGGAVGLWLASPRAQARLPATLRLELEADGERVRARRMVGGIGRVA